MNIDDACLVIADVDVSDAFYTRLGLERRMRNVRFADFSIGSGPRLAMWIEPSIAESIGPSYPAGAGESFALTLDLETAYFEDAVSESGQPPACESPMVVVDPDGFLLRLRESADGIRRMSEIDLTVTDLDHTTAFLLELGFAMLDPTGRQSTSRGSRFSDSTGDSRAFEAGQVTLTIFLGGRHPRSPRAQASELGVAPSTGRLMLAIELDTGEEVDEMYRLLLTRGLEASGPPSVYEWGTRSAYFVDADGYIWEIYAWVETPR